MNKYKDLRISAICAVDYEFGIGKDNTLPWNEPEDLKYFKQFTENKIVVMGSKTFISLPKLLPNRINVVISSKADQFSTHLKKPDRIFNDIDSCISILHSEYPRMDIVIIGGGSMYTAFQDYIDEFHLTKFNTVYNCDTYLNFDFSNFAMSEIQHPTLNIEKYTRILA